MSFLPLSRAGNNGTANAIDYSLKRKATLARYPDRPHERKSPAFAGLFLLRKLADQDEIASFSWRYRQIAASHSAAANASAQTR